MWWSAVRTLVCGAGLAVIAGRCPVGRTGGRVLRESCGRVVTCGTRRRGSRTNMRRREAQRPLPRIDRARTRSGARRARLRAVGRGTRLCSRRASRCATGSCVLPDTRSPLATSEATNRRAARAHAARVGGARRTRAVHVGIADGPFAAALAASLVGGSCRRGRAGRFWRRGRWPRSNATTLVDVLHRLGLRTLGELSPRSPAPDVLGRFGNDGATAHRLAAGSTSVRQPRARRRPTSRGKPLGPAAERVDSAGRSSSQLGRRTARAVVGARPRVHAPAHRGGDRARRMLRADVRLDSLQRGHRLGSGALQR